MYICKFKYTLYAGFPNKLQDRLKNRDRFKIFNSHNFKTQEH